jgi:hypothetical protein
MRPRLSTQTGTAVRLVRGSIVLAVSVWFFSGVFRLPDGTFLRSGLGDWVDPYFINFLLEHWHHSVWTLTDPSSPPMYFPVRGTLGYSHGLILYAPFYILVRSFLGPFPAYNVTLFLVLETGALCLYLIFRQFVRLGFIESLLLCAFFFSSANTINVRTGVWSQRASVFLIPPILLLALVSARMPPGRSRLGLAWLSGLLASLLLTQDFYTAALAVLVSALFLAGALPVAPTLIEGGDPGQVSRRPSRWWLIVACVSLVWAVLVQVHPIPRIIIGPLTFSATHPTRPLLFAILTSGWFVCWQSDLVGRITNWWTRDRQYMLAFTLGGVIGCLVFFWIYLGAYREHPAFPENQLIGSLTAVDLARLDWRRLGAYGTLRSFILVLVAAILACVPWFQQRNNRLYCLWFLFVSFIVLVIPLRFNELSIWKMLFARLPGVSVIRDPTRIIEVYELAVALLAGLLLAQLPRSSPFRISIVLVVLLLLVTTWNRSVLNFARPTSVYARWVEAPIDIDSSCRSFFIKRASDAYTSRSFHTWSLYAVDSMFISLHHSIPTLNGYSAWWPDQWNLANPQEPGYLGVVERWIARHHLRDVCALDIEARTIRPYVPAPTEP